jgi:2-C-methyl-D-erythritol 4-phosphate cytidylyltransferase
MPAFALILPAAGKSTRFGQSRSKLLETLGGTTVISRALQPFLDHPQLANVVIPSGDAESIRSALRQPLDPRIELCAGGATRAHSVLAALQRVPTTVEWVAVHDAARPLVSRAVIDRTVAAAHQHGAAVPALPVALTIKQATGPLPARVERTVPRQTLWAMQTPQIMRRAELLDAFARCPLPLDQVTDDVQLLELVGKAVWLVEGEERNLKITTAIDLRIAELQLQRDG